MPTDEQLTAFRRLLDAYCDSALLRLRSTPDPTQNRETLDGLVDVAERNFWALFNHATEPVKRMVPRCADPEELATARAVLARVVNERNAAFDLLREIVNNPGQPCSLGSINSHYSRHISRLFVEQARTVVYGPPSGEGVAEDGGS